MAKSKKQKATKYVVYSSDSEILVTTRIDEKAMLKEWFGEGCGRNKEDYDTEEVEDNEKCVCITSTLRYYH